MTTPGAPAASFLDELQRYRAARHQRLTAEWGWLSLVARFVLSPGDNEIDVGTARFVDGTVTMSLRDDVAGTDEDGRPVRQHVWPAEASSGARTLVVGGRRYELLRQGERAAIRVRDPSAPTRASFPGLSFFAPDERFRVTARLVREGAPATLPLAQGLGGVIDHRCPGALVFPLLGHEHRLLPVLDDDAPGQYFLIFKDATNGSESYGGGRFLYLEPADERGLVTLDFNRAFNPPCALTPYAACPVAPPENRLPVAVTAGERAPASAHG